jgi:hypothetical protein
LVKVLHVTDEGMAETVDQLGHRMKIRTDVMRHKGLRPKAGESWVIDRSLGPWSFAAVMAETVQPEPVDFLGAVKLHGPGEVPECHLPADGRHVAQAVYPDLYRLLKEIHGPVGNQINWSLPDGQTSSVDVGAPVVSPSWTPEAGEVILLPVTFCDWEATEVTSITGNGLTWTRIAQAQTKKHGTRAEVWLGEGTTPVAGSYTITLDGRTPLLVATPLRVTGANDVPVDVVEVQVGVTAEQPFCRIIPTENNAFLVAMLMRAHNLNDTNPGEVAVNGPWNQAPLEWQSLASYSYGDSAAFIDISGRLLLEPEDVVAYGEFVSPDDWVMVVVSIKPDLEIGIPYFTVPFSSPLTDGQRIISSGCPNVDPYGDSLGGPLPITAFTPSFSEAFS